MKAVTAIVALLTIAALAAIGGNVPPVAAQQSLPAPTNVAAADGSNPGEVLVSWTKVPAAKFYRIGWIAREDYIAISEAGGDPLEAFAFIDVSNRGQNSHTLTRLTPGVAYLFLAATNTARYGTPQYSTPAALTLKAAPSSVIGSASAKITWNAAAGAKYYRIGWIAREDYIAISEAGGDPLEAFAFIDVSNRGQAEHTVTRLTPDVTYLFLVASNSARYGTPKWLSAPVTLTPQGDSSGPGQPGDGTNEPKEPAPPCPAPDHPVFSNPEPRPVPSVRGDYDADDDGLIEVANLAQLDAMRYDPGGTGTPTTADALFYYTAFPNAVAGMGCPDAGCAGYELVADLDFDTNGNGRPDAGDDYWNDGAGWLPISRFGATFDGGGHTISNLFINRNVEDVDNIGLFGTAGTIRGVGLRSVAVLAEGRDLYNRGSKGVGSLAGSSSNVSDSYATGTVAVTSRYDARESGVGGLVGSGRNISGSCVAVDVTSVGGNVGGLVGSGGNISGSYATGAVTSEGSNVGGLVGSSAGSISSSYATGTMTSEGSNVGGLVGSSAGNISSSYATGAVTGGRDYIGGLVGWGWGYRHAISISDSYATGDVTGGSWVGGLVGSGGNISDSYATGAVTGSGGNVAGLIGSVTGSISSSYATGVVTGAGDNVGGLVGQSLSYRLAISDSYATGAVIGTGGNVGGLVGSGGTVSGSYATGDVTGTGGDVGGLVGSGGGTVSGSYATGGRDRRGRPCRWPGRVWRRHRQRQLRHRGRDRRGRPCRWPGRVFPLQRHHQRQLRHRRRCRQRRQRWWPGRIQ